MNLWEDDLMPVTIVTGGQWGDEGKGRIVDMLAAEADIVVRCQGGPNAGHTIVNDLGKFVLHTVPSGIFSERSRSVIGPGVVISPAGLATELQELAAAGIDISRLLISERAHLIMPYHKLFEHLDEEGHSGTLRLGSTKQGVGPAYADKAARTGIQAGDLRDLSSFARRLKEVLPIKNRILEGVYGNSPLNADDIISAIEPAAAFLKPFIGDTSIPLHDALGSGKRVLLEGQLGMMRDLDWGAYPYVTSSCPSPSGMVAGAGIPPQHVDRVIGIVKAYTSAVGEGPFPTELLNEDGDWLRKQGAEYGATTGRPRRCGWFDAPAVSWGSRIGGFTEIVLTKLDVLTGRASIPVCTGYTRAGQPLSQSEAAYGWQDLQPVYETKPGWIEDLGSCRSMADLPAAAQDYVAFLEEQIPSPISMVSVGPQRDAIIMRA